MFCSREINLNSKRTPNIFLQKVILKILFTAVELVDRREMMLGQDVVDPFLSLLDAGLSGGLEHVGEEILEVLVRQILLGRDEVVLVLWIPLEFVDPRETTRVQCDLEL